jgi:hypothetical protein
MGKILRPFDRMRRQRNDAEYPPGNAPALTPDVGVPDQPLDVLPVTGVAGVAQVLRFTANVSHWCGADRSAN